MCDTINIGVLGCASIAERFVIPAIKQNKKFELFGVASRTDDKAKKFSKKFETKAFINYQSLIDAEEVQAIYIPLPNSMHYEWVKKSLLKGKHVLVEKSLACDFDEVKELNDLAKKNKCILIENFQFRFHSQFQYIKKMIESGVIGDLRSVRSSFGFPPFSDSNNIRYVKQLGGGALLDAGAYPIKIVQELIDDLLYVDSASLFIDDNKKVDIWGSAQLKTKNTKITAQISFGFDNFYKCDVELWGSIGYIRANRIFTAPPGFKPEIEIYTTQGKKLVELPEDNHFVNMLNYFHDSIKTSVVSEYLSNINQARLISELREKANE